MNEGAPTGGVCIGAGVDDAGSTYACVSGCEGVGCEKLNVDTTPPVFGIFMGTGFSVVDLRVEALRRAFVLSAFAGFMDFIW